LGEKETEEIISKIFKKVAFEGKTNKPRGYKALAIVATKK